MVIKRLVLVTLVSLTLVLLDVCHGKDKNQVRVCNPKYVANCSVVTYEPEGSPGQLLTNLSFVFLVPYGNNVTLGALLSSTTGMQFKMQRKFCEYAKLKILVHNEIDGTNNVRLHLPCPYPAGLFSFSKLKFPPHRMAVPLRSGHYQITVEFFLTATREQLILFTVPFTYDGNRKRDKE